MAELGLEPRAIGFSRPLPLSPVSISGLSKQPGRVPEKSEEKREGFYHTTFSSILHMKKLGDVLSFFFFKEGSWALRVILPWKWRGLVQLARLCDLAGAVEADSFVEGLCVHSHYANGPSSSLPIN